MTEVRPGLFARTEGGPGQPADESSRVITFLMTAELNVCIRVAKDGQVSVVSASLGSARALSVQQG